MAGNRRRYRNLNLVSNDLGMMGWIQGTPRWEDDHVWGQYGRIGREIRARSGFPPQADIGRRAGLRSIDA